MAAFQPDVQQEVVIAGQVYRVADHPAAPGLVYSQEGRQATVFQLLDERGDSHALKVFKARFRLPSLVTLTEHLAPFAALPGLTACRRAVLMPQREAGLLRQYPDLTYAVLMPWIAGPTWLDTLLDQRPLTTDQSLALARMLTACLTGLEQRGLAHCDLSGPNVLLPMLASPAAREGAGIELVDLEQLFGPSLERPPALPAGSPGYAHPAGAQGLWRLDADRFAGAVLLAEMLGWCDERVRTAAWGESYFDPAEMGQEGERYRLLLDVLDARWGGPIASLVARAWTSGALVECPTFGEWLVTLPEGSDHDGRPDRPETQARATTTRLPNAEHVGGEQAVYVLNAVPPASAELATPLSVPGADADTLAPLFDQGVAAIDQGEWRAARELLTEVVYRAPDYRRHGRSAQALLAEVERQLVASAPPPTLVRATPFRQLWKIGLAGIVIASIVIVVAGLYLRATWPGPATSTPPITPAAAAPARALTATGGDVAPRAATPAVASPMGATPAVEHIAPTKPASATDGPSAVPATRPGAGGPGPQPPTVPASLGAAAGATGSGGLVPAAATAAVPPLATIPPAVPSLQPRSVVALVDEANRVWASVIAKDEAPLSALPLVYGGRWLAEMRTSIVEMRGRGHYRVARQVAPLEVRGIRDLGDERRRVEALVSERWDDRLYDRNGSLVRVYPGHVEQRYVFEQIDGRWLIVESDLVRSEAGTPAVTPTIAQPAPTPAPRAKTPAQLAQLQATVHRAILSLPGTSSGAFVHLTHPGASTADDPTMVLPAASVIKLFIAGAAYQQVAAGRWRADDIFTLAQAAKTGGTGILRDRPAGTTYTLDQLIEIMLVHSDNTAANMVIDRLGGFEPVNAFSRSAGMANTAMRRRLFDLDAQAQGIDNTTTTGDVALFLRLLIDGQIVNRAASERILDILEQRARIDPNWLLASLPRDLRAAHITGTLPGVRADAAIVEAGDQRYILVLFVRDPNEPAMEAAIARASAEIFAAVTSP